MLEIRARRRRVGAWLRTTGYTDAIGVMLNFRSKISWKASGGFGNCVVLMDVMIRAKFAAKSCLLNGGMSIAIGVSLAAIRAGM